MFDGALLQPRAQALQEEFIRKVLTPKCAVLAASFCETAIEIQHANQARPGATPIGDSQYRTVMFQQPRQHMMGVLPDSLSDDYRCILGNLAKDFQTKLLAIDESVLFDWIIGVGAFHPIAFTFDRGYELSFHLG